tara:strand:- start:637 stop:957 length:321 start_codon:yes stop_codon:yes gene_type:complete
MKNTFTSYRTKVVNRVEHNQLASNLVYPLDKGYHMVLKCDKEFVESRLRFTFNLPRSKNYDVIQNKYVIRVSFMGEEDILVYNQNGNYWIVRKDSPTTLQSIVDKF